MSGSFNFASFSGRGARGGRGGWGVGTVVGDLGRDQVRDLVTYVPTSLGGGQSIPKFPSPEMRARFLRRTAVFSLSADASSWITMVSVHAGTDATGRGGNVYTLTNVMSTAIPPAPELVLYSPDIPAPFSIHEVDTAPVPREIVQPGPLQDGQIVEEFLDGEFRNPERLPLPFREVVPNPDGEFNRALVEAMAAVLNVPGATVVLSAPEDQAALWIAAVSPAVPEGFGFSTSEKASTLEEFPKSTSTMLVTSLKEKARLADMRMSGRVVIFATDEPIPDITGFLPARAPQQEPELQPVPSAEPFLQFPHEVLGEPTDLEEDPFNTAAVAAPTVGAVGMGGAVIPGETLPGANPFLNAEPAPEPDPIPGATPVPVRGGGDEANAHVGSLTPVEAANLEHFNARWWFDHLRAHPARALEIALLLPTHFGPNQRELALAACVVEWSISLPTAFEELVAPVLGGLDPHFRDKVFRLVDTHFTPLTRLDGGWLNHLYTLGAGPEMAGPTHANNVEDER